MRDTKCILLFGGITLSVMLAIATALMLAPQNPARDPSAPVPAQTAAAGLLYTFNAPGILQETGSMQQSTSPYWWLNSGGELIIQNNFGETMQGSAPLLNKWHIAYALNNPLDTDGGTHPQNLLRLVSKSTWDNLSEEVHFYINADNLSSSPNRNQSNGLLLMSRYQDSGQTLYYAGIRVDGTTVIKKKYKGIYYTMAQKQILPGTYSIQAAAGMSQNLLPHQQWIGLKATTVTNPDHSVTVTLFMQSSTGAWNQILQSTDRGDSAVGNTPPITGTAYAGIRTDFMDVEFSNVSLQSM
jgi:hypothetical protein